VLSDAESRRARQRSASTRRSLCAQLPAARAMDNRSSSRVLSGYTLGAMRDAATREDTYTAEQRGEATSRIETRLDGEAHAEEGDKDEWLAAGADGSVKVKSGPVTAAKLDIPQDGDNEIDCLRKLRMAQLKGAAMQRQQWLSMGHGTYEQLEGEAKFLEVVGAHPRVVCHLCVTGSLDAQMMHTRLKALCTTHLETYFCWLDAEAAPMMLAMVALERLPALLLGREGKVVEQLTGLDRSFTIESLAYELGEHRAIDFEEGTDYSRGLYPKGGCTTQTAGRARAPAPAHDLSDDDDDLSD